MSTQTTTARMTPAELRRKLLAPPSDPTPIPPPPDDATLAIRVRRPAESSNLPIGEVIRPEGIVFPSGNPRTTPLPTHQRLDVGEQSRLAAAQAEEIARLRAEMQEQKTLLDEMRQIMEEATTKEAEHLEIIAAQDKETSELREHLRAIEEQITNEKPKTPDELSEWADELEKENAKLNQERKRLEEERRQLHEDEDSLEHQMRNMEVQMARERAMMARQETELRRLSSEIQQELELMQRGDVNLRDHLARFQRRHQEVFSATSPSGNSGVFQVPPSAAVRAPSASQAPSSQAPQAADEENSGLLRRLFRGGK